MNGKLLLAVLLTLGLIDTARAQATKALDPYRTTAPTICDAFIGLPDGLRPYTAVPVLVGKWEVPVPFFLLDKGMLRDPAWEYGETKNVGDGFVQIEFTAKDSGKRAFLYMDTSQHGKTLMCMFSL